MKIELLIYLRISKDYNSLQKLSFLAVSDSLKMIRYAQLNINDVDYLLTFLINLFQSPLSK